MQPQSFSQALPFLLPFVKACLHDHDYTRYSLARPAKSTIIEGLSSLFKTLFSAILAVMCHFSVVLHRFNKNLIYLVSIRIEKYCFYVYTIVIEGLNIIIGKSLSSICI